MLGRALKTIRESAGLSLSEASDLLSLSKSYISEIENEKKIPALDTLEKYSAAFEIPVSSLIFFSENYDSFEGEFSKKVRSFLNKGIIRAMKAIL